MSGVPGGGDRPLLPSEKEDFGAYLRRVREARSMPLADVAQTTRVKLRWLEMVENGHLDELPATVFVRGFVSAYARAIGADEKQALRLLSVRLGSDSAERDAVHTSFRRRARSKHRVAIGAAVVAILIAIVVAIALVAR